ncbi:hypothetical protein [Xylanimonas ulmi]|uniref:Uncharacterized protein n=1 Tax=Xylanimonas ulmi TaxID=228973 RepID=A0A4Q7M3E3_9MICO|nr:hypothetical protein [Xylanibacterium ulmi]RZS60459.1 hypothetical protein EV386_0717 [Xylanibacterium ulmi]
MADTLAAPFALRDARLIVGPGTGEEREFSSSVSHVMFEPRVAWAPAVGLNDVGGNYAVERVEWWLALEYPQDWAEAASLSLFLATHAGQKREMLFVPSQRFATHQVRTTVVLAPGPIGGDAGPLLTGIVAMPVVGWPDVEER